MTKKVTGNKQKSDRPVCLTINCYLFPLESKDLMNLKEKIIHESMKLFSIKGFVSTSIDDILNASKSSKGGFYNHFKSKEELFSYVIDEARHIWRERNLIGIDEQNDPILNIRHLLINFRDRYLKDSENFPGGCIFITLLVELKNQQPHLANEISKGFVGLKRILKRNLDQGKKMGLLQETANTQAISEMLFNGILGATVAYNGQKSEECLDLSINCMIDYLEKFKN